MTRISDFVAQYCNSEISAETRQGGESLVVDILRFAKYHSLDLRKEFCGQEGAKRYENFTRNLATLSVACDDKTKEKIIAIWERLRPPEFDPLSLADPKERKKIAADPLFGVNLLYQAAVEKVFEPSFSEKKTKETPELLLGIENLVISGGGAKGAVLPCAFRELFKQAPQFMNQINEVAGSSVGAISAAMLATGISRETLLEIGGVNIEALLGTSLIGKSGKNLVCFIRQCLRINILLRLTEMDEAKKALFRDKDPKMAKKIEEQLHEPNVEEAEITFEMLAYLREIDPEHFKELHVTATDKKSSSLVVFSSENSPLIDIAEACRASASIPVVFKPVQMQIGEEKKTLYDGGVLDNVPVQIFENKAHSPDKTMVFVFEKAIPIGGKSVFDPSSPEAPYKPSIKSGILRGPFLRAATGVNPETSSDVLKAQGLRKVKEKYPHVVSVPSDLSTISFKRASENVEKYSKLGKQIMQSFLDQVPVPPSAPLPQKVSKIKEKKLAKTPVSNSMKREKYFSIFKQAMSNFLGSFSFLSIPLFF